MIQLIKVLDLLDPSAPLNPGENQKGIRIACLTSRLGVSQDPDSVSYQVEKRHGVNFKSIDGRVVENI